MFNIKYSQEAYENLDNFINSYKNVFIKLYTDTWIDDEKIIIQNYIALWNALYTKIKGKIIHILTPDIVLWFSKKGNIEKYCITQIDNIRIFIHYTENVNKKERNIEKLEFHKK